MILLCVNTQIITIYRTFIGLQLQKAEVHPNTIFRNPFYYHRLINSVSRNHFQNTNPNTYILFRLWLRVKYKTKECT